MTGLFSITTSQKLFQKLVRSFASFCKDPSEEGLFEVLFPLYHLREWIYPNGYGSYKTKDRLDRSEEEKLHEYLHSLPEYQTVRHLCNSAKHYTANSSLTTEVFQGLRAGWGTCGDSLGVTHFVVDGVEIRRIFWPVYSTYFKYFKKKDPEFIASLVGSLKN